MEAYFIINFMPLMILLALVAMTYVNRDVDIPASNLFTVNIVIMLVITVITTWNDYTDVSGLAAAEAERIIWIHTLTCTLSYVLRPCLILLEILIILNNNKFRMLCTIPAIINAIIFSTAIFGSRIAFFVNENNRWYGGPLRPTIYVTQLFYLILLLGISVYSFRVGDKRKSAVIIVIFIQAVLVAILEYHGVEPSHTDSITALCMLEYYIYLSAVYRQELNVKLDNYVGEIEDAGLKLKKLTKEVIVAFANSIDAKDEYTHGHSSRVAEYSKRLATMNGKSDQECDEIYYAGLLHDIGKIGIPESIITKEGKLTPEEYETIKQHPVLGKQILGSISDFPYLSVGALGHHERYDGKGYPEGLKGQDIPEIARIIAVADAYDAMSSKRSYRDPIPQQKVREEIVKGTGTQFDPEYARLMLHLIDEDLEYAMSEREEARKLGRGEDFLVGEHGSNVSEGMLLTPFMTTVRMTVSPREPNQKMAPAPSLLLFDSLDGFVYDDEKKKKELNYFEYGEIWLDGRYVTDGARKMQTNVQKTESANVHKDNEFLIEAIRINDHALIRIIGKKKTIEVIIALPDGTRYLFLGLTGEQCRISNVSVNKSETEAPADSIPRIAEAISYVNVPAGDVPNVQVDGYRTAHSEGIRIVDGLQIRFHAKCLPTARLVWHCPFIDIFCSDDGIVNGDSYRDLAFMRFDGEFWECDPNCSARLNVNRNDDFKGWEAWKKFNMDGYDATVTFQVSNNEITIITENAGISIRNRAIVTDIDKTIYAAVTGDQVAITNVRIDQVRGTK